jgi:branched-chain amino acid transport system permease protein
VTERSETDHIDQNTLADEVAVANPGESTIISAPEPGVDGAPGWPWNRLRRTVTAPPAWERHQYVAIAVFLVAVGLILPQVMTSRAQQFNTNLWLAYAIAGIGFYWMVGLAGRFAFCQVFMMALGGYTSAWITRSLGDEWFLLAVVGAMALTGLLAFLIAGAVRKAQFFYFAIASMAVTQIGVQVFQKAEAFTGPNGTQSGISAPVVFGREIIQDSEIFWLFLVTIGLVLVAGAFIERSPMRRDAVATRDNILVAKVAGVPSTRIQMVLFAMGSALGALSGALIGHWNGVIATDTFGFDLAIGIFLMLYLGGVGSMWGPVLGAAVFVALPQLLSGIQTYYSIVYGLLLLVVILALPEGLVGGLNRVWRFLGSLIRKRRTREVADVAG